MFTALPTATTTIPVRHFSTACLAPGGALDAIAKPICMSRQLQQLDLDHNHP
jgi:hypothetical protein